MLEIELVVDNRRKPGPGRSCCLPAMLGKGNSIVGEVAVGEPKIPWDDPGRVGEVISSYTHAVACGVLGWDEALMPGHLGRDDDAL